MGTHRQFAWWDENRFDYHSFLENEPVLIDRGKTQQKLVTLIFVWFLVCTHQLMLGLCGLGGWLTQFSVQSIQLLSSEIYLDLSDHKQ